MARVTVDVSRLREVLLGPAGPGVRWAEQVGRRVESNAKVNLTQVGRVDSGRLRSSISHNVDVDPTRWRVHVLIGSDVNYALYVHEGTGLYGPKRRRIRPKKAKVLAWPMPNPTHFAASVRGMKPTPYLVDALEEVFPGQVHRTTG